MTLFLKFEFFYNFDRHFYFDNQNYLLLYNKQKFIVYILYYIVFYFLEESLVLDGNSFFQNVAFQNGLAIFLQNSLKTVQIRNNVLSNHSVANKNQIEGSVLVLENSGNITIVNSFFKNNFGISGTCLSYSETSYLYLLYIIHSFN